MKNIIDCGGIQPEPIEPPVGEVLIDPTSQENDAIQLASHRFHRQNTGETCTAVSATPGGEPPVDIGEVLGDNAL